MQHSVRYNFIMNLILTGTQMLYPLITFTYAARILGVDGIGEASFAFSVLSYFTKFAAIGLPTYGIRAFAQVRDDKRQLSKTYHELMAVSLIAMSISYLVFFICLASVPRFAQCKELLLISSLNVVLTILGTQWFYQGVEEYGHITKCGLIARAIALAVLLIFVREPDDIPAYMWSYLISETGFAVLNIFHIRKYVSFRYLGNYNLRRHLRPLLVFFAMTVSTTVYTNLDTVMLGFLSTKTEVGFYNAALKISRVLTTVATVFGTVLMPRITNLLKRREEAEAQKLIQTAMEFLIVISLPLMIFSYFFAPRMVLLLCGSEFGFSATVLRYLLPAVLFGALSNLFGYQILAPYGKEKYITIAVAAGAGLDFILNALLIPLQGAVGAAIATCMAELLVVILEGWFLRDKLAVVFGCFRPLVLVSAIAGPVLICVPLSRLDFCGNFFMLLICGVIFVVLYYLILLLVRETLIKEATAQVMGHISGILGKKKKKGD